MISRVQLQDILRAGIIPGALSGLAGGVVFGIAVMETDWLVSIAQIVRLDSTSAGFIVHMVVAALIGAGFGVLVRSHVQTAGETLFWGLSYGVFWWFLGALTLSPLIQGEGLTWDLESAQKAFPAFLGHVLYGGVTGLVLVLLRRHRQVWGDGLIIDVGALVRGGLAGLSSGAILGAALSPQDKLIVAAPVSIDTSSLAGWAIILLLGLTAGVGFALLYPRPTDGAGPGLIRGTVYGFLWWVVGPLTLVPVLAGGKLVWSVDAVQGLFITLPGYLLFGAGIALIYQFLGGLVRLLFSDIIGSGGEEGVGTQGLRIVGRSVGAGLAGGLLFSLLMLQIDFLPKVAELVGSTSRVTGFIVHLAIAIIIGTSYGILFGRQSYDFVSALGWGLSYGFFWSVLGPMTLMPLFLGAPPQWTAEAVGGLFPNLIGHLAYGAGLGIIFYYLEARYTPWWIPRNQAQTTLVAQRQTQLLTSAPALWTLIMIIGLTLAILLGKATGDAPTYVETGANPASPTESMEIGLATEPLRPK